MAATATQCSQLLGTVHRLSKTSGEEKDTTPAHGGEKTTRSDRHTQGVLNPFPVSQARRLGGLVRFLFSIPLIPTKRGRKEERKKGRKEERKKGRRSKERKEDGRRKKKEGERKGGEGA